MGKAIRDNVRSDEKVGLACGSPTRNDVAAAQRNHETNEEETHENIDDFAIRVRLKADERLKALIGTEAFERACFELRGNQKPTAQHCTNLTEACSDECTSISSKRGVERRQEKRNLAKWDWERNYGKRAFKNSRVDDQPPTSTIQHHKEPNQKSTSSWWKLGARSIVCTPPIPRSGQL